jgi:hypothetical protein
MRGVAPLLLLLVAGSACTQTTELLGASTVTCAGIGPAIHLGGPAREGCSGALAARFGRYALCTCNDLNLTGGGLYVSGPGAPTPTKGQPGPGPGAPAPRVFAASVGTDGNLRVGADGDPRVGPMTEVSGSLVTAGQDRAVFVHGGHVQGNLRGAGSFATMTTMGVWISGEMVSNGDVTGMFKVVGGPLHVPAGATVGPDVQSMGVARETVSVPPPCGCGAAQALDLAAEVEARRTRNANKDLTFSHELLADVQGPQTLDLNCGEYYLPTIQSSPGAPITLKVHGRAALFVAGDVRLGNNFAVVLDERAELDLVVAGQFDTMGRVFGSPMTPASTRLWVASGTVSLPDQIQFSAAVYAPDAIFSAGANLNFSGSLYVRTALVAGDVRLAYDPAVMLAGQVCDVAPPMPVE